MQLLRIVILALLAALPGCAAAPHQPAHYLFGLMGDMPYSHAQVNLLDSLIDRVNDEPLAFSAHVGDITSGEGPCDDEWMHARKRQFERFRAPFVLLPGDNEWTDCHRTGFDPLERLAKWRQLFCVPIAIRGFTRQPNEYCENARWGLESMVFVGLNVPGSNNNLGRTRAMDAEHSKRMRAVFAWLDEGAALISGGKTLVVLMQANPFLHPRGGAPDGFAELRARLTRLAETHPGKIVLVHGDTHLYHDDEPLPGLRRIEVPGSPQIRWVRATLSRAGLQTELADPP